MCRKDERFFFMQVITVLQTVIALNSCYFPSKKKTEEENLVKLVRHPRCFQRIPFHTGTSKQAHYLWGWVVFLQSSSSGRPGEVRKKRSIFEIKGKRTYRNKKCNPAH